MCSTHGSSRFGKDDEDHGYISAHDSEERSA